VSRELDVVVVGAGVVGLAVAAALARAGRSVVVLERNEDIAREVTRRNSGVGHAGSYYPEGTWKARACAAGREQLYARCRERRIPHRRTGKLVVAVDETECAHLEALRTRGTANGVPGLEIVDGAAVRRCEPRVAARAALVSPESGIVDAHALAMDFLAEAEAHGAVLVRRAELSGVEATGTAYRLSVASGRERQTVTAAAVVNAAGLAADRVAALAGLDVEALGYRIHYCKGDYFALAPGVPLAVSRLVYPVPHGPGLGVHATLDLAGRIRFGPDAYFVEAPRYDVDPTRAADFAAAVRRYLPDLRDEWLAPDQAGVRPRLAGPGEPFRDFVVAEESAHGLPGWVDLVGIESPGLTAAPALADAVVDLLRG